VSSTAIEVVMNLLLVDDNEVLQMTRKLIFERAGYVVLMASNGAQALSMLKANPVRVAVVDYHLPDVDGDTLCRSMKEQNPGMHIVLASGLIPDDLSDCPDFVVVKGGSPLELVNKVSTLSRAA